MKESKSTIIDKTCWQRWEYVLWSPRDWKFRGHPESVRGKGPGEGEKL